MPIPKFQTPPTFPIQDEDVLCIASFDICGWAHPIFTGHYESPSGWEIRIADYGLLVQHVEFYLPERERALRKDICGLFGQSRYEEYLAELPDDFCAQLGHKVIEIGFESLAEKYPSGFEDVSLRTILIRRADRTQKRVTIEIDPFRSGQEEIDEGRFFELWDMIHIHAPFKLPEPEHKPTRSNRQLKMDARRQRRAEKKNKRNDLGPSEDQEGS